MAHESTVTVTAEENCSPDELRELRTYLIEADGLRGRVSARERPPSAGQLGATVDALLVALGQGGVATALASAILSWIRHRTSDVVLKVKRDDGTVIELSARRLRQVDVRDLHREVEDLSRAIDAPQRNHADPQ